jgi:FKBP-type peptidyl-prolyl cis-trans isomerase
MKSLRTPLLFSSLVLFVAGSVPPVMANDSATLQTLDDIVSKPGDIPDLLLIKPTSPPGRNNTKKKPVSSSLTKPREKASTRTKVKADTSALTQQNARKDEKIVDLTRQLAGLQAELARGMAAPERAAAEMKQQLDEKNRELAELITRAEKAETSLASVVAGGSVAITSKTTEREQLITVLQEKVTALTAADIAKKLEFAAVKVQDSREIDRLNVALKDNQAQVASLTGQVSVLTEKHNLLKEGESERSLALTTAQQSLTESHKQRDEFQTKWQYATTTINAQTEKLAALQKVQGETPALSASIPAPQPGNELQAYALGTLWGQEVTAAVAKMTSEGYSLIQQQVISGVNDALTGSFKVPRETVIAELNAIKQQVTAEKSTTNKAAKPSADVYLATFSKQPGTKKAEMGYYYRIKAKGLGKIRDTDTVAIVVKESLSNGRVIKDMAKTGKVLALPLKQFPPLFASAIWQMRNKGTLIMAVPPALAYGEQGKSPEIPPNSTMVYEIKVVDVRPAVS